MDHRGEKRSRSRRVINRTRAHGARPLLGATRVETICGRDWSLTGAFCTYTGDEPSAGTGQPLVSHMQYQLWHETENTTVIASLREVA